MAGRLAATPSIHALPLMSSPAPTPLPLLESFGAAARLTSRPPDLSHAHEIALAIPPVSIRAPCGGEPDGSIQTVILEEFQSTPTWVMVK
jgi:hypothetical protein